MLPRLVCLWVVALAVGCSSRMSPREFVVTRFGAVGDGIASDTRALQRAIDACAEAGGGVVVVPKGRFLSGSIFLKPKVRLRVDRHGVILGTLDKAEYPRV